MSHFRIRPRWRPRPRPPLPDRIIDAGVQGERTFLAWQRTGLSMAGLGAAIVHFGGAATQHISTATGLFGIAAGALLIALATPRYHHSIEAARGERSAVAPGVPLLATVAAAALAVGALLLTIDAGFA